MKKLLLWAKQTYFHDGLDFRVRIFNTLAFIGTGAGFFFAVWALATGAGVVNSLANLAASALAIGLLVFARRTGLYQLCFLVTVVAVFLVMFPVMFFSAGGLHSGMPAFFVFAVAFTVLMLEGKTRVVVTALQLALYVAICLVALYWPGTVTPFPTQAEADMDIVIGFVAASAALALAIGQHIAVYDREQKRLQQLDREKTELFGNISHEMKTPLAILSTLAHTMRGKFESIPQAQGAVADAMLIETEADRLGMLVSQVLELAQISEGRMVRDKKPCNIDEIIHSAMGAHFSTSLSGNRIDIKIDDGLPAVWADAPRIEQVVVNLVANAERHTRDGRIVVSAFLRDSGVAVEVQDNGEGMDKEKIPLIFERYYTGAKDTGTGLGLYICKHIVEAHGSKIAVQSKPGQGSTFTFALSTAPSQTGTLPPPT